MEKRYYGYLKTPIGFIQIATSIDAVISVNFVEEKEELEERTEILDDALIQFDEYFKGERKSFNLKYEMNGTDFQKKVWSELLNIPYGETISYKVLAIRVGNERACRAIGLANGKNKINILIPCHRVIGTNKSMTGYVGGIHRKKWLLKHEKSHI